MLSAQEQNQISHISFRAAPTAQNMIDVSVFPIGAYVVVDSVWCSGEWYMGKRLTSEQRVTRHGKIIGHIVGGIDEEHKPCTQFQFKPDDGEAFWFCLPSTHYFMRIAD